MAAAFSTYFVTDEFLTEEDLEPGGVHRLEPPPPPYAAAAQSTTTTTMKEEEESRRRRRRMRDAFMLEEGNFLDLSVEAVYINECFRYVFLPEDIVPYFPNEEACQGDFECNEETCLFRGQVPVMYGSHHDSRPDKKESFAQSLRYRSVSVREADANLQKGKERAGYVTDAALVLCNYAMYEEVTLDDFPYKRAALRLLRKGAPKVGEHESLRFWRFRNTPWPSFIQPWTPAYCRSCGFACKPANKKGRCLIGCERNTADKRRKYEEKGGFVPAAWVVTEPIYQKQWRLQRKLREFLVDEESLWFLDRQEEEAVRQEKEKEEEEKAVAATTAQEAAREALFKGLQHVQQRWEKQQHEGGGGGGGATSSKEEETSKARDQETSKGARSKRGGGGGGGQEEEEEEKKQEEGGGGGGSSSQLPATLILTSGEWQQFWEYEPTFENSNHKTPPPMGGFQEHYNRLFERHRHRIPNVLRRDHKVLEQRQFILRPSVQMFVLGGPHVRLYEDSLVKNLGGRQSTTDGSISFFGLPPGAMDEEGNVEEELEEVEQRRKLIKDFICEKMMQGDLRPFLPSQHPEAGMYGYEEQSYGGGGGDDGNYDGRFGPLEQQPQEPAPPPSYAQVAAAPPPPEGYYDQWPRYVDPNAVVQDQLTAAAMAVAGHPIRRRGGGGGGGTATAFQWMEQGRVYLDNESEGEALSWSS